MCVLTFSSTWTLETRTVVNVSWQNVNYNLGQKMLQPRYSWGGYAVRSCDIMRYWLRSATRARSAQILRVASMSNRSLHRAISHDRTVDQPHEYLGSNDFFFGQGSNLEKPTFLCSPVCSWWKVTTISELMKSWAIVKRWCFTLQVGSKKRAKVSPKAVCWFCWLHRASLISVFFLLFCEVT